MERLNLTGFELLIEGAVVEPRLALARRTKRSTMMNTSDDRQDDQDDGSEMLAHVVVTTV